MNIITINSDQNLEQYHLVARFCEMRRRTFSEQKKWDLDLFGDFEFDQYDSPEATYILAVQDGEILAGARLMPTSITRSGNIYTYMIYDAHNGLLPGMPSGLCYETPPRSDDIWELTRLASPEPKAAVPVIKAAIEYLASRSVKRCLYLGPKSFKRYARMLGYETNFVGPEVGNDSGSFRAISFSVVGDKDAA